MYRPQLAPPRLKVVGQLSPLGPLCSWPVWEVVLVKNMLNDVKCSSVLPKKSESFDLQPPPKDHFGQSLILNITI